MCHNVSITSDTRGVWADADSPGIGGKQATMNLPKPDLRKASWDCPPQPLCHRKQKRPHLQLAGNKCAFLSYFAQAFGRSCILLSSQLPLQKESLCSLLPIFHSLSHLSKRSKNDFDTTHLLLPLLVKQQGTPMAATSPAEFGEFLLPADVTPVFIHK